MIVLFLLVMTEPCGFGNDRYPEIGSNTPKPTWPIIEDAPLGLYVSLLHHEPCQIRYIQFGNGVSILVKWYGGGLTLPLFFSIFVVR